MAPRVVALTLLRAPDSGPVRAQTSLVYRAPMRRHTDPPAPPRDRVGRFVNWGRTAASRPMRWHLPVDEAGLRRLVEDAANRGRRLRVVGAGHSFSSIAVPDVDGDAISLDAWVGGPAIDRERGVVTVPAGMRMRDLSAALLREGFSLPIVGSVQAQSVAGAIATGTHGSSLQHGNIASLVTGLRLVTGTGDVLVIDDERLDGARVHLGALGALTEVTLRIRPAVRLHQTIEHVPIEAVPSALADIAASAEYVKVWWLPHAPLAQVVRYTQTTDRPTRWPAASTRRWIDERIMHRWTFPAMVALQHRRPSLTGPINSRLFRVYLGANSQVGQDILMLTTPMPLRHRETEAAVPMTQAATALAGVLDLFRDGRPAANFPLEIQVRAWRRHVDEPGARRGHVPDRRVQHGRPGLPGLLRAVLAGDATPRRSPALGQGVRPRPRRTPPPLPRLRPLPAIACATDPQRVFGSDAFTRLLGA